MLNIYYLFNYHLVLEDFESSIAEYPEYNVLNFNVLNMSFSLDNAADMSRRISNTGVP